MGWIPAFAGMTVWWGPPHLGHNSAALNIDQKSAVIRPLSANLMKQSLWKSLPVLCAAAVVAFGAYYWLGSRPTNGRLDVTFRVVGKDGTVRLVRACADVFAEGAGGSRVVGLVFPVASDGTSPAAPGDA